MAAETGGRCLETQTACLLGVGAPQCLHPRLAVSQDARHRYPEVVIQLDHL